METIDLGVKPEEMYGGLPPAGPAQMGNEKRYPSFRYEGPKDLDLPDEGTMEIKFRKVSETERKSTGGDRYECCVEVLCICEVEGEDEEKGEDAAPKSAEEALDKIAEAVMAAKKG
jgi:hypothetical protein